ncbi:uncharacterized protein L203_105889 [Cryptococcus depauperatus CBS 7841]|uniref:alpha-galactosidase n=1 Tax=Cryptococcus depauperatus CBS 7841 TaxID=1295531 RepID=A0AAJ8M4E2_9TREE
MLFTSVLSASMLLVTGTLASSLGSSLNHTSVWKPQVGTPWQIVLNKDATTKSSIQILPDVKVYDLDLFDNDASTFAKLKADGIRLICYFSAGSYEDWRSDKKEFLDTDIGAPLDGWPGENWLKTSSSNVRRIMSSRIQLAATKGCDAIDADNIDGYNNDNGLGLTEDDAVDFVRFLAGEALSHNMSFGLKNAIEIAPKVLDVTAFAVNEQCVEHSECDDLSVFLRANKAVLHIEYPREPVDTRSIADSCPHLDTGANSHGLSTVLKRMSLDNWVKNCP